MNKTYAILAFVVIVLGLGLFYFQAKPYVIEVQPETLLSDINENTRYVSVDELAERLIEGDPSVQLIDVRDHNDFMDFGLPGAENIPLPGLLLPENLEIFDAYGKDFIFYSNGDIQANQAWIIAHRLGYKNLYVLKGGVNCWFQNIIQPKTPDQSEPQEAFDLYQFRLGARQYFTGGGAPVETTAPAEGIEFTRKKKNTKVEGGC
jgi:rhodanese-related sulfurtransferase